MVVGRDVYFAADDRFHAVGRGLVIKIRRREKIPVVRYGHGGHAPARRFSRELANFTSAIQQRVIGMKMQMYKIRRRHVKLS